METNNPWNLTKSDGKKMIVRIIMAILYQEEVEGRTCTWNELPCKMKDYGAKHLDLRWKGQHRNINYYMKRSFGGFNKFMKKQQDLYCIDNHYLKLTSQARAIYLRMLAEEDDFIWIEN